MQNSGRDHSQGCGSVHLPHPDPSLDGSGFLYDFKETTVSLIYSFFVHKVEGSNY